MTGKEFDEIFKPKINELCEAITKRAIENDLIMFDGIQVIKFRDFIYGFKFNCSHKSMRGFIQKVYTVMYNPKTEKYIWHEGYPKEPMNDGRVVN